MTGHYVSFENNRITECKLELPIYGAWVADVAFATDAAVPASGTLTVNDLALKGSVLPVGTSFAGALRARIVGGGAGWGKVIPGQAYANPAGISLSLILGDVARAVGETVNVASNVQVGLAYIRESAPASRVLRQLAGGSWWVDAAGVTQVGPRTNTSPIISLFQVITYDGATRMADVATEVLADWTPGRTFSAPVLGATLTIAAVYHRIGNDGVGRIQVLTS